MNYMYDILVNFQKEFYYFYEWNKSDKITNIKKIPIFVIENYLFDDFKYNNIKIDTNFLKIIYKKTNLYNKNYIKYSFLVTNKKEIIALLFNEKGILVKKSSLLLEEEKEVLDEIENKNITKINILENKKNIKRNYCRKKLEKIEYIEAFLKKEKNPNKLKFLYYDIFKKEKNDIQDIKSEILEESYKKNSNKTNNIYKTIKLFNKIPN